MGEALGAEGFVVRARGLEEQRLAEIEDEPAAGGRGRCRGGDVAEVAHAGKEAVLAAEAEVGLDDSGGAGVFAEGEVGEEVEGWAEGCAGALAGGEGLDVLLAAGGELFVAEGGEAEGFGE